MQTSTKRQLIVFVLVTYSVSWGMFLAGKLSGQTPVLLLGIWAPSLVCIGLNLAYYGKRGFLKLIGRFGRIRFKWYWWVAVLLLPASIHLTGRSLWQSFYAGTVDLSLLDFAYWPGALLSSFLIAGLGEELGWRGFALPRLQRHFSPVTASVILAFVHLFWHLPTYWLGQGIHNVPFIYVLAFVLPWTFLFNWLYNRSGGSLLVAVGFHAISNASLSIVRFMPSDTEVPIQPGLLTQISLPIELGGPYLMVCAVYIAVALIVLWKGGFHKVNKDIP